VSKNTQTATGLVAFAVAGLALASGFLPITNEVVLSTAAFSPYLMLCGPMSVVLLTLARRWILAIVAVGLTIATLAVQLPLYRGSDLTIRLTAAGRPEVSAWVRYHSGKRLGKDVVGGVESAHRPPVGRGAGESAGPGDAPTAYLHRECDRTGSYIKNTQRACRGADINQVSYFESVITLVFFSISSRLRTSIHHRQIGLYP
jgi:hypothetical protein